jgi:orotidine-5'-phosphate decarboxylase
MRVLACGRGAVAPAGMYNSGFAKIEGFAVNFINKLTAAWTSNNSLLCVGLDPDIARFPAHLRNRPDAIVEFCKAIIDATADLACAFKPQIAYFAAFGAETQLEAICRYLRDTYPHIPLILDAKRGDIGATAHQYAREAFDRYGADAVTVSPYMGFDSVEPYLEWSDRGVIVLCRTSNPGGSDLQFLDVGGVPLYQHVARLVAEKWNRNGQLALVVGATFPDELAQVRAIVGDMPLLVPGVGAQGGDIEATVRAGRTGNGTGMMINSSRAILYAGPEGNEDFAAAARRVALETRDAINRYR